MKTKIRLLIVEDSEDDTVLLVREITRAGYSVEKERVETTEDFLEALKKGGWDAVIADYTLPLFNGMKALAIWKESGLDIPFLLVSGTVGEEVAVEAMRAGAQDYILKSNLTRLGPAIKREIVEAKMRKERREAENALRESQERMARIIETIAEGIYILDADGRIIFANKNAEDIFGIPRDQLHTRAYNDPRWKLKNTNGQLFAEEDHPFVKVKNAGKPVFGMEFVTERPDGKSVVVSVNAAPFKDENGRFTGMIATQNDITERKLLEAQLASAQKMESIGQLAAGIAHEINTPIQYIGDNTRFLDDSFKSLLAVVKAYGRLREVLANTGSAPAEAMEEIASIEKEADAEFLLDEIPRAISQSLEGVGRVASIARAMKEFSHPATEKAAVNMVDAIASTITISRNEWKYVADVVTNFEPDLPLVPLVGGEFKQVILNLIVNAAHAIGDAAAAGNGSKDKGTITISAGKKGDDVEVRIADTGTGIPPEAQPHIFEPFFTTKKAGKGTGQGLAIARSIIVEKHGGKISFETEAGKGTVFIIRLPLEGGGKGLSTREPVGETAML